MLNAIKNEPNGKMNQVPTKRILNMLIHFYHKYVNNSFIRIDRIISSEVTLMSKNTNEKIINILEYLEFKSNRKGFQNQISGVYNYGLVLYKTQNRSTQAHISKHKSYRTKSLHFTLCTRTEYVNIYKY